MVANRTPALHRRLIAVPVAALVLAAGCGRKDVPLPPQILRPEQTRDLVVEQRGTEAVLTWSYPSMTSAGGPLPGVEEIQVWRATVPAGQEPPPPTSERERQVRRQLLTARGEVLEALGPAELEAATRGPNLRVTDDLEAWYAEHADELPAVLWYAVRTVCCGGHPSEMSPIARLAPQLPPAPPEGLTAEPTEAGIRLSWRPGEGATLVERRQAGGDWAPVTENPVPGGEWLDETVVQGQTWRYRLRTVRHVEDVGPVIGIPGEEVVVDYPDTYPPPAPDNVVCLPEAARVTVRWGEVAGASSYRVLRRREDGAWDRVAEVGQPTPVEDPSPPAGEVEYAVTAVDAAGNESAPSTCSVRVARAP